MQQDKMLAEVQKLIEIPEHWIKNRSAEDQFGRPCRAEDKAAIRFSILGAINRVAHLTNSHGVAERVCITLAERLAARLGYDLPQTKDRSGVAVELVAVFNKIATHDGIIFLIQASMQKGK